MGLTSFLAVLLVTARGRAARLGLAARRLTPAWLVGTLLVMNLVDVTLFWLPVWAAFAVAWGALGADSPRGGSALEASR
jgi:hypothetical protein